jgi:hypothetical protein
MPSELAVHIKRLSGASRTMYSTHHSATVSKESPSPVRSRPTDQPGSYPAGRPLIHPRNQHYPTGSKPSTTGRPELPPGLAAEAIPVLRQSSSCPRVQWSLHLVPEFSGLTQAGHSACEIGSNRTRCVQPTG